MARLRELAKFGSGVAAWEAVVHGSLWASGQTFELFGLTLTPTVNAVQTIVPAIVALGLAYFAWRVPPRDAAARRAAA